MQNALIALIISVFTMYGFAALADTTRSSSEKKSAAASLETIRTHLELMSLTLTERELYLAGVHQLLLDLEDSDAEFKTEYQSAPSERSAQFQILEAFLPQAVAADGDRRCVYAGSLSELDINGRYCMRPRDISCAPRIQCNPLVFGNGVCAPAGKSATQMCVRNSKPISAIVAQLANKAGEWETFRTELGAYCANPLPAQRRVCPMITNRIAQIERVIGRNPRAPASAASGARATAAAPPIAASVNGTSGDRIQISRGVTIEPVREASAAPRPVVQPTSAIAPAPTAQRAASSCSGTALLEDLKGPSDRSSGGFNLMTLGEAQQMMCSRINDPVWIANKRRMIANRRAAAFSFDAHSRRYYSGWFATVSENFEACIIAARSGRVPDSGVSATVTVGGDSAEIRLSSGPSLTTHVNQQGRTFALHDVSLCRIRSNSPYVAPAAITSAPTRSSRSAR